MDFQSDGGRRLFANMAEVAASFGKAQQMLEHAADAIRRRANDLHDEKIAWERRRSALDDSINELVLRHPNLKSGSS